MNLKKTWMAAAIAFSLTTTAAWAAENSAPHRQGQHHVRGMHGGHGDFGRHMFGRIAATLNLTDQQKEFAKQLMTDSRKQAEPVVTQLRQTREELSAAVKANNIAAIDQIAQRQATLTAQLTALRNKAMAGFYAQLTPEQRAQVDEFHSRVKDRASRWHKG